MGYFACNVSSVYTLSVGGSQPGRNFKLRILACINNLVSCEKYLKAFNNDCLLREFSNYRLQEYI